MQKSPTNTRASEARESVAGYGFQFVWAARRCLRLLDPNCSVTQVVIEGLHPQDETDLGDGKEDFLGIDVSEYQGGTRIGDVKRIVVSQLKCGVRHPDRPWTIARLCYGKKGDPRSSVIGRLAAILKTFSDAKQPPTWIRERLVLQVVSNRPVADQCRKLLTKLRNFFVLNPRNFQRFDKAFYSACKMNDREQADFKTLRDAARLNPSEMFLFLSCLDTSSFDVESPILQKLNLEQEARLYNPIGARDGVARLCEVVEDAATKAARSPIDKEAVLACFDTSAENFFPAPCMVELPSLVVQTDDVLNTVAALKAPDTGAVLVHGKAGIGKSVTMQNVASLLPPGSHVVLFDCYAKGDTVLPHKRRFPESVLCTQIVNELSLLLATNIHLIRNKASQTDLWSRMDRAIVTASSRLPKGALLVLIIDAADNAAEAYHCDASPQRENVFLPAIWHLTLPPNVRLVVTARTHRRKLLQAPPRVKQVKLSGFTPKNSQVYLGSTLPELDAVSLGPRFHKCTDGVPRLQFYWCAELKQKNADIAHVEVKTRKAFGLPELYLDWVTSAHSTLGNEVDLKSAISVMRAQALPIDPAIFSLALKVSEDQGIDFLEGLTPGMVAEQNGFRFRDEDFEDFLETLLSDDSKAKAHSILADLCLGQRRQSPYSVANIAGHLCHAKRFEETLQIALDRSDIDVIPESSRRLSLNLERIAFGLDAAREQGARGPALELIYAAAEITRQKEVNRNSLADFPELAVQHGHHEGLSDMLGSLPDRDGRGKLRFNIAAELACQPELRVEATRQLKAALAWLDVHIAGLRGYRSHLNYYVEDSINYALAELRLHGSAEAENAIRRWRHGKMRLEAVQILFRELGRQESHRHSLTLLRACPKHALIQAAAFSGLFEARVPVPKILVHKLTKKLAAWMRAHPKHREACQSWIGHFVELAANSKAEEVYTLGILESIIGQERKFPSRLYDTSDWADWDRYLKAVSLRQVLKSEDVTIESVFGASEEVAKAIRKVRDQPTYENDFGYNSVRVLRLILPVYKLRAQTLSGRISAKNAWNAIRPLLEKCIRSDDFRHSGSDPFALKLISVAVGALTLAKQPQSSFFSEIVALTGKHLGASALYVWLDIMRKLAPYKALHACCLEVSDKVLAYVESANMRASEKAKSLMACATALRHFSAVESKVLFERALEISVNVDQDAPYLLGCLGTMCRHGAKSAQPDVRLALACLYRNAITRLQPLMADEETVPWGEFICAISSADAKSGQEAAFDFQRLGWSKLAVLSPWLVEGLLEGKQVNLAHALQILSLASLSRKRMEIECEGMAILAAKDKILAAKYFSFLAKDVLRDSNYENRGSFCHQLAAIAKKHRIASSLVQDIELSASFYSRAANWNKAGHDSYSYPEAKRQSAKGVPSKMRLTKNPVMAFVQILGKSNSEGAQYETLINLALRTQGPERIAILNTLTAENNYSGSARSSLIPTLLDRLLREWGTMPRVQTWAQGNLGVYLQRELPFLYPYDNPYSANENLLLENPIWHQIDSLDLLNAISRHLHALSALRLFELAKIFTKHLQPNESRATAERILARIVSPQDFTLLPETPIAESSTIVPFIASCFAYPDNRIRWTAFHAVRRMIDIQADSVIAECVENSHYEGGMRWLSVREWFLFLLWHISKSNPDLLLSYSGRIFEHIEKLDLPHAGIQYLAKQILTELVKRRSTVLSQEQRTLVERIAEPQQCLVLKDRWNSGFGMSPKRGNWRFSFDHMDMFPYWYSPLSHCFGLHRCDVAEKAEPWIVDQWGWSRDECFQQDDAPKDESNWRLSSHDHGSYPTIERLDFHVQRHGMMMAAGELIHNNPILPDKEGGETSWDDWIQCHAFDADPAISSDLRQPVPLLATLHGILPEGFLSSGTVLYDVLSRSVKQIVFQDHWIVGGAHYTVATEGLRLTFYVESAFVNPQTSRALLAAIQFGDPNNQFSIPEIGVSHRQNLDEIEAASRKRLEDYDEDGRTVFSGGFELEPLSVLFHSERGRHVADVAWPNLSRTWRTITPMFIDAMKLRMDGNSFRYLDAQGTCVVEPDVWDDSEMADSYEPSCSSGNRLKIHRDNLISFLQMRNRDMIVRVGVRKFQTERRREKTEEYDNGQKKCFLIRNDGQCEGLEEDR